VGQLETLEAIARLRLLAHNVEDRVNELSAYEKKNFESSKAQRTNRINTASFFENPNCNSLTKVHQSLVVKGGAA